MVVITLQEKNGGWVHLNMLSVPGILPPHWNFLPMLPPNLEISRTSRHFRGLRVGHRSTRHTGHTTEMSSRTGQAQNKGLGGFGWLVNGWPFRDVGKYSFFFGGEDEIWDEDDDDLFVVSFLGSCFLEVLEDDLFFWDLFPMALLEFFLVAWKMDG